MAGKTGGNKVANYGQDIKAILDIVTEIKVQNATRDAAIESIDSLAKKNYQCIEGNGKPGLKADIEKIQGSMKLISWVSGIVGTGIIIDVFTRIIK